MNNSKYHFRAVTKPNDLLAIFSSNHDRGNFFKLFFFNVKIEEKPNKHQVFSRDLDYHEITMLIRTW